MNSKSNKMFIIVCPANVFTGGPLAQHQLAKKLMSFNQDVFMYYYPNTMNDPIHVNFKEYEIPFVKELFDDSNCIVIMPEVKTDLVFKLQHSVKVIWWLSVDNYLFFTVKEPLVTFRKFVKKVLFSIKSCLGLITYFNIDNQNHLKMNVIHLAQSEYAFDFLYKRSFNPYFLHCHLLDQFYTLRPLLPKERSNIVLYNPKKGKKFTNTIIEFCKGEIEFIKIENFSPSQVIDLLGTAKVYIDFGEHPGRDRFPREAAISGCILITGKKGSAFNNVDINIPVNYKFGDDETFLPDIKDLILSVFENYEDHLNKQSDYLNSILSEKVVFENEVEQLIQITL